MTALTIRQLNERTYALLTEQALRHGRTIEEEARVILEAVLDRPAKDILTAVHDSILELDISDAPLPTRP